MELITCKEPWLNDHLSVINTILHSKYHLQVESELNFSLPFKCEVLYCQLIRSRIPHFYSCTNINCKFSLCKELKTIYTHFLNCIKIKCLLCNSARKTICREYLQLISSNLLIKMSIDNSL